MTRHMRRIARPTGARTPTPETEESTTTPMTVTESKIPTDDALDAFKKSIRDEIMAELQSSLAKVPSVVASGDEASTVLFRQMALAIAEISDQGTNRKRVAPEILASRHDAMEKMGELILAARKLPSDERPRYRLVAKCYLKERLVEPYQRTADKRVVPTEIYWTNAPNTAMRPVNASAKRIFEQFSAWIGNTGDMVGHHAQPVWITDKGAVLAAPTASATAHGLSLNAEPFDLDVDNKPDVGNGATENDGELEFVDAVDPRRPEIHILGTVAPPARRMTPGERAQ